MRRAELRILQIGAIAIVIAASTFNAFELDRFFVPKDLVLHVVALVAGAIAMRHIVITRSDRFLVWFLGLSAISALFATNHWLAFRALAISTSAALLFWIARSMNLEERLALVNAIALAIVVVAITSLVQAYGVDLAIFSVNRVPGGTLGNRNFVAHAAAFGYPLLLFAAFVSERRFAWRGIAVTIVTAALVLTRSRAAWLAFAAVLLVVFAGVLLSPVMRRERRTWSRLAALLLFAAGGVAVALVVPNALKWRSRNPYLESVQRVTDFKGGSGRGRLVQYERSMLMSLRHPLLGVGPGNWSVDYPRFAIRDDPSMSDSDAGMTFNPWPSSDWVAFVSERGLAATLLLLLFLWGVVARGLRAHPPGSQVSGVRSQDIIGAPDTRHPTPGGPGDALEPVPTYTIAAARVALVGLIAGAIVTGLFDAVLLLALPAYLVFAAAGALSTAGEPAGYRFAVIACIVISAAGAVRSVSQLVAMDIYSTRSDRASLSRAASIDPGNYRLQMRLARGRCAHALAAHDLYPSAVAAREASRGCH